MDSNRDQNLALVKRFWDDLYRRDFAKVASYFTEDALYQDVPAPDHGAVGPAQIERRLRIGLESIDKYVHHLHRMVCDGNVVITEHQEDWHFRTGEVVELPFVSIHEIEGEQFKLWRDYWDYNTLIGGAPQWWIDQLANASYE